LNLSLNLNWALQPAQAQGGALLEALELAQEQARQGQRA
jgi:hypothetical protein